MKKHGKYLFFCVANDSVGFGHLSRSLILATVFCKSGNDADFLVFGSESARTRVIQSGFKCFFCSWPQNSEACWEMDELNSSLMFYHALIVDLSHPLFFSFFIEDKRKTCLSLLEKFDGVKVVIDSVAEQSFLRRFPTVGISLQIVPYVTNIPSPTGSWRTLKGPDYAVLSQSENLLAKKRSIRTKADRILITCGGSDPTCLTNKIMESLDGLVDPLDLTVVVGPLFSKKLSTEIKALAHSGRHRAKVVESPPSLIDLMVWSDIAIATSGLTKYELAATGTPAIVMSIDSFHDQVNQPFAALGSVIDIGYEWSSHHLVREVEQLRQDRKKRSNMSQAGQHLVDGFGAQRILEEVEEIIKC
jgi:UDP-2,4-diacetamido-2,4,6-trideoxy-beta-L-altropyranose hydrolase